MEDTSRQVIGEAISTSAKLFYVLVSICIIYVFAAYSKIDRSSAISNLQALDVLYALVTLSEDVKDGARELTGFDITRFYRRAEVEFYRRANTEISSDVHNIENSIAREFPDAPVPGGLLKSVPMRMAVGARCDIAVISGSPGVKYTFATFEVVGKIYTVKSKQVHLVSFGRCGAGYAKEFNAILFQTNDGEAVIALPKSFENAFPGLRPPKPFKSFVFQEVNKFRDTLPRLVGKYVELNEPFVMLHVQALRHYVLSYATYRHGGFYRAEELEAAISALFQEAEGRAKFVGVETTVTQIVRLGPLVFLLIAWELWRHVRRIPPSKEYESIWFPFDVQFPLAAAIATLFALAPVGIGLMVGYLFIVSQGLGLVVFGKVVTLHGLLALDFPVAASIGWGRGMDYWVIALIAPFIALIALLALVSIRLLAIIRANVRSSR